MGSEEGKPEHVFKSLWVRLGQRPKSLLSGEGESGKCFLKDKVVIFCEWFSKDKRQVHQTGRGRLELLAEDQVGEGVNSFFLCIWMENSQGFCSLACYLSDVLEEQSFRGTDGFLVTRSYEIKWLVGKINETVFVCRAHKAGCADLGWQRLGEGEDLAFGYKQLHMDLVCVSGEVGTGGW